MLADPTTEQFKSNRPYLPDSSGLLTQKDYNVWVHNALEDLETQIEAQAGEFKVFMSDTPPLQPEEGDLWYNTMKLQMLVRYDGAWVASAIPLVLDDSFVSLSNTVEHNREVAAEGLRDALAQIHEVSNRPERLYRMVYDVAEQGIQLVNTKTTEKFLIKLDGSDGVNVNVTGTGIQIDASALSNELHALEQTVASGSNVAAIDTRLGVVETNVANFAEYNSCKS